MISEPVKKEEVAEKRIGFTVVLHVFMIVVASAYPEGEFFLWLTIGLVAEALIVFRILLLWKRYKHYTKRYYTLQVYWMLTGAAIYAVIPFVRVTYSTAYFAIMLVGTLLLFLLGYSSRSWLAKVFLNPKKINLLRMLPIVLFVIIMIGLFTMAVLQVKEMHPNVGLSVFLYMLGAFLLFVAGPFSMTEERLEELKNAD
ncbi:hypothetical protein QWT69_03790 [Sporosarcina oncorhynchi]|uniref:Uncharacterized protein n=1 Tax=Sporosarcina oncorhynchi TaxID=3056444 RepID=A0ABZ0L9C8_9BACL|nr:hypothetical protein [Sporosarcina sp. T2O-4]WOV88257.1 hypothetical protein QWT69_03790 [Sporosarcina sp. T2O-4]